MRQRRNISLQEVAEQTGIARKTLYARENNTVTRFDLKVIDAIGKYFGVKLSELLEYIPDDSPKQQTARK